jgi:WD40 repeat protein
MTCVAFSPKNDTLATGSADGSVTLWDYTNGLSLERSILRNYTGQSGSISAVAFLPDGKQIASASEDATLLIDRLSDGAITRTIQDSNAIGAMAVSPDGKTILTRSTNLKFWRVSDGVLLQVYDQETQGAGPVAISGDGKYFAYGRSDGVLVLAWMPLWMDAVSQSHGEITFHCQGGSGRYQVQARSSLSSGSWQDLGGPSTNAIFTHACLSPMFYRVQGLPNP